MEKSGKSTDAHSGERQVLEGDVAWLAEPKDGSRFANGHSALRGILVEDGDGHLPPETVARAAQKGLALREKLKRNGLAVSVAHARDLKDRRQLPDATIRNMARFFARHRIDKRSENWGEDDNPSADYVSWLLWGGDPGREWAERRVAEMEDDRATAGASPRQQE